MSKLERILEETYSVKLKNPKKMQDAIKIVGSKVNWMEGSKGEFLVYSPAHKDKLIGILSRHGFSYN